MRRVVPINPITETIKKSEWKPRVVARYPPIAAAAAAKSSVKVECTLQTKDSLPCSIFLEKSPIHAGY